MNIGKTIPENFIAQSELYQNKSALMHKQNGVYVSITYRELRLLVKSCANGFINECRLVNGDTVALSSENRPEWVIADMGIMHAGGIVVPIHTNLAPRLFAHILNDSKARIIIISSQEMFAKLLQIIKEVPHLEYIVTIFECGGNCRRTDLCGKTILRFADVCATNKLELQDTLVETEPGPDSIATIVYTSGTTGLPKGVPLTHKNICSDVLGTNARIPVLQGDVFLSFLPLSHVLERTAGYYMPILQGATIAYAESYKDLLKNVKEVRPTVIIAIPRFYEKIYDKIWQNVKKKSFLGQKLFYFTLRATSRTFGYRIMKKILTAGITRNFGGRLRILVSGGAPLDARIAGFLDKIGLVVYEGYGLTETAPIISVNYSENNSYGTVGKKLENCEIILAADKEILVRGPMVFSGYWGSVSDNRSPIDSDGWFHTGDLGFIDDRGYMSIIGRKKEVAVSTLGNKIWPEHIEKNLNIHPAISQSIIIAHNRKYVTALIVPHWHYIAEIVSGRSRLAEKSKDLARDTAVVAYFKNIIDGINRDMSSHEKIYNFYLLENEFTTDNEELTPSQKLCRSVIEHRYHREIEDMYRVN